MSAKTSPRKSSSGRSVRRGQTPPIRRLLVGEALRSWVPSSVFVTAAALFAVLGAADLVSAATSVTGLSTATILLVVFVSMRDHFFSGTSLERGVSAALAVTWVLIFVIAVVRHDFPGAPLAAGVLHPGQDEIVLPALRHYSLVVDGHFRAAREMQSRVGTYRLEVAPSGEAPIELRGAFKDQWGRQRVGRRGSAPVETQRTSMAHRVDTAGDRSVAIRLAAVDANLEPELMVSAYPAGWPWLLPLVGVAWVLIALAWEKWRSGDGNVVTTAAVSFAIAYFFVTWGSPHPEMRSLIGAGFLGVLFGSPAAMLLWRAVPRRWFATR